MAQLGLNVSGLVLEGFRRVDEWRLMENSINFDQVPVIDPLALQNLSPDELKRTERLVLDAVDGQRTVREIIQHTAVSSFDAVKIIYLFLQSMVLRVRP